MQIKEVQVIQIKPYEKNPRKNDGTVDYVANSIQEFGFKVPVLLDKNNIIVAGHTRYKAAQKLGLQSIPCIYADDLTDEQIKAYRLVDNKTAEISDWDFDLLGVELEEIFDLDMSLFGFLDYEPQEIKNTSKEINTDDFSDSEFQHECPKCGFKYNE